MRQAGAQVAAAKAAIGNVIFGQEPVVEQALITVLCGGHALLIGLFGLAKTKLVETMGIVLGLDASPRIQFALLLRGSRPVEISVDSGVVRDSEGGGMAEEMRRDTPQAIKNSGSGCSRSPVTVERPWPLR